MQVGDLVRPKHTKSLLGIIVKQVQSKRWLIQWSNQKSSYERKENLEVLDG